MDNGRTRRFLDPLLREVAESGAWVGAHPDVVLKMGVKDVLHRTRHLGWGVGTVLYRTKSEFQESLPGRLVTAGPRVIKRNRGKGGLGIWKVELPGRGDCGPPVRVLEAAQPGPRIMHPASAEPFQALRRKKEDDWTPVMMELLGIDAASLPIIWNADFLYGPRDASGADTYVLCEVNVGVVFAIPGDAPAAIARLASARSKVGIRPGLTAIALTMQNRSGGCSRHTRLG